MDCSILCVSFSLAEQLCIWCYYVLCYYVTMLLCFWNKPEQQGQLCWDHEYFKWVIIDMGKAMAPHSSTLAWKIPWTEEPGGLLSMRSLRVGRDFTFTFHFHALEKEMATHSSVLAWGIPGMGEPGELLSKGSHRVRHDWSDLAIAVVLGIL